MGFKPTLQEEEFVIRQEFLRRKKMEEEKLAALADAERKALCDLHFMKCPKCGSDLHTIDYEGVTVDKCTQCEGVWLDRGELEQILEHDHSIIGNLLHAFGDWESKRKTKQS